MHAKVWNTKPGPLSVSQRKSQKRGPSWEHQNASLHRDHFGVCHLGGQFESCAITSKNVAGACVNGDTEGMIQKGFLAR